MEPSDLPRPDPDPADRARVRCPRREFWWDTTYMVKALWRGSSSPSSSSTTTPSTPRCGECSSGASRSPTSGRSDPGPTAAAAAPQGVARVTGLEHRGGCCHPLLDVYVSSMKLRFCDERGDAGFSWIVDERMTRTSHALAVEGRVWLVDPVDWPEAVERASSLGEPAGVLQLLDRHNRDCRTLAAGLGVQRVVAPDDLPGTPFECIPVRRGRRWRETALWWPEKQTLVVAEALGTNRFFTGGKAALGVHLLLRLTPPDVLAGYEPRHLLVGHGEGIHGPDTTEAVRDAIASSRRRLPGTLARLPFSG
jgi:hypothetical protein